jgi:AcrR family transcriptional regulator
MKTWSDDNPKAGLMERKRSSIVQAAMNAFLDTGYAESSVNRIAADAGVSIKTLYRHFESKDDLFSAVMDAACSAEPHSLDEPNWYEEIPPIGLSLAGQEYLRHTLSADQLALYRVVTRDAHRFPELGRRYREEVVGRQYALLVDYLDRWAPRMRWKITDKHSVAVVFAGLLRGELFESALHAGRLPKEKEIVHDAQTAAERLLALLESGCFYQKHTQKKIRG